MALLNRIAYVAIEREATAGTVETFAAADTAIKAINPVLTVDGQRIERDIASTKLGSWRADTGARSGTLAFDFELEGSGTTGTPPSWDDAMIGLGFASDTVSSVSVTYTPDSPTLAGQGEKASQTTNSGTVSVALFNNGIRYTLVGCYGDWTLRLVNGQPAIMSVTYTGKWGGAADVAMSTVAPTYLTQVPPAVLSASFTIDGYAAVVRELVINGGNTVELRPDINDSTGWHSALITKRDITGTLATEALLAAPYDWFTKGTTAGLNITNLSVAAGTSAGNTHTITAAHVQYGLPTPGGSGLGELTVPLRFCGEGSDDDITIALT